MPVGGEDVGPAVEVEVEEEAAERQGQQGGPPDGRARAFVDEQAVALVVIQGHHLGREVADHQVGPARAVVVGGVGPHPRAGHPRVAERHPGQHPDVFERAVAAVLEELVGLRVVGHEEVRPAVVVEVEHDDAQRLRRGRAHAGGRRHVFEGRVAPVAIERAALPLIRLGRAVRLLVARQRAEQVGLGRPVHVVADEQVEMAVGVIVEPQGGGREAGVADPRRVGDVREGAVARAPEQAVGPQHGQIDVHVPVVVEVGGGPAQAVQGDVEPRAPGDVGERPVAVVAVQRGVRLRFAPPGPRGAVDEQQVLPPVAVGVEPQGARAERLRHVLGPESPGVVREADAGRLGDVGEDRPGRGQGGGRHGGGQGRGQQSAPWNGAASRAEALTACRIGRAPSGVAGW